MSCVRRLVSERGFTKLHTFSRCIDCRYFRLSLPSPTPSPSEASGLSSGVAPRSTFTKTRCVRSRSVFPARCQIQRSTHNSKYILMQRERPYIQRSNNSVTHRTRWWPLQGDTVSSRLPEYPWSARQSPCRRPRLGLGLTQRRPCQQPALMRAGTRPTAIVASRRRALHEDASLGHSL